MFRFYIFQITIYIILIFTFLIFKIFNKDLILKLRQEFDKECDEAVKYSYNVLQNQDDEDNKRLQEVIVQNVEQIQSDYNYEISQLNEQQSEQHTPYQLTSVKTENLLRATHEQYIVQVWSLIVQILENIFDQDMQNNINETLQYDQFTQNQSVLSTVASNALQIYQENVEQYNEKTEKLNELKQKLQHEQEQIDTLQQQKELQKMEFNKALNEINNKSVQLLKQTEQISIEKPKQIQAESRIKQEINKQSINNTNLLSLRTTVQIINEIYSQKIKVDTQAISEGRQLQNIRQFVFKYFNQKYGNMSSTAENKQSAIQKFIYSVSYHSNQDFNCLLFVHEINNDVGENLKEKIIQTIQKINFQDKRRWLQNIKQIPYLQNSQKLQDAINNKDAKLAEDLVKRVMLQQELKACELYKNIFKLYDLKHIGRVNSFSFDKILQTLGINEEVMRLKLTNRAARGQPDVEFTQGWLIVEKVQQLTNQYVQEEQQSQEEQELKQVKPQDRPTKIQQFDNQQLNLDDLQ